MDNTGLLVLNISLQVLWGSLEVHIFDLWQLFKHTNLCYLLFPSFTWIPQERQSWWTVCKVTIQNLWWKSDSKTKNLHWSRNNSSEALLQHTLGLPRPCSRKSPATWSAKGVWQPALLNDSDSLLAASRITQLSRKQSLSNPLRVCSMSEV